MEISKNEQLSRFETDIEGQFAVVDYRFKDGIYSIPRVYVPKQFEGKGIGAKLVELTVNIIENEGAKIIPICPFVSVYFKRHPERKSLLAKEWCNIKTS
jgi:predicted GNAT family acetyltransferase